MQYIIIEEKCSSCGLCADVCPVEAISQMGPYAIDDQLCIKCGVCLDECPSMAIKVVEEEGV